MSGVVGSKLNIRGSGLVGSLGTDGQHLLSAGAGKTNVFETVAAGGGDMVKIHHSEEVGVSVAAIQYAEIFTTDYQAYKIYVSRLAGPQYAKFAFLVGTTSQTGTYLVKYTASSSIPTTGSIHSVNGYNLTTGANMQGTMGMQNAIGDNSGRATSFEITVWNPLSTDLMTNASITASGSGSDTYYSDWRSSVTYQGLHAIDGFEIVESNTDDIVNCQTSVYGLKV